VRGLTCCVLALALVVATAPLADASLAEHDPNDVSFRLDVRRSESTARPRGSSAGMLVEFYRSIPDDGPKVKVFFDAFGARSADFVLRFRVFEGGAACTFVRLSDHRRFSTSPTERRWRSLFCEYERPDRMKRVADVRWRVQAVLPGVGRDLAPNAGWYPHI
jgi:hypothetical protein